VSGGAYAIAMALAAALLSAALFSGCRSSASGNPAIIFESIRSDFLHGNLDTAQQRAEKARKDFSARNPDWAMKFRLLEAEILTYQGRRPEVIALLNSPDVSYPTAGDLAIKRNLLCGLVHARLGQAQQSGRELLEARHLTDLSNSQLNGEVLRTEAQVQVYHDHLPEAVQLFGKSLKVARDHGDTFLEASDLLNLGLVAVQLEHHDEALSLLGKAADLARPIQARIVTEAALGNLGVAYFSLGDFEKALSSFQQAEEEAKEIGTTSAQVDWLWDAGSSYYELGNLQEAKRCYEQSLKAARAIDAPDEITGIESQLAFLLYQQGQFDSAKTHSEEAIRAARQSGDKFAEGEPLFLQALLAAHQPNSQDAEQMLLQVHHDWADSPSLQWEIENALASFYAGSHHSQRAELWYRNSIHTFETQRSSVKDEELKLPFFANGEALYRDYAEFLIDSSRPDEALQLLDLGRARTLEEGLGLANSTPHAMAGTAQSVARNLDATLLFYSLGPQKSYLWAVTENRTSLFVLPKQSEIEARVQRYQKAILRSTDPLRETNEDARLLYDTLVAPAASMIPKGSRVFIIPDGALNELNFETLLVPGAGELHYWIEDATVTNASSIRLLARSNPMASGANEKKLLLIGDPIAKGTEFESLPNAPAEVSDVEKHFPSDERMVFTQAQATPTVYEASKPDQFSYIHFVAHGTASRLSPLDSAVVLSASPTHPDSYKLYARDIVHQPLRAKLVIISACYGSGIRTYAGEGLVGLSWAFLRAGSHNVIGGLWEVNDASTPLLMDRLYSDLEAGSRPDAALRAAKLSLIHSQAIYRKPLYWAAFQLYAGS
jgi:CHAT domain-containing protein